MGRKRKTAVTPTKSKGEEIIIKAPPVPSTSSSALSSNFKNEEEFQAEMDRVISDVMDESLYLLQKDPREYHPFYLRTFKYISIGQKLGYIPSFKKVNAIWEKYDKICENQVSLIGLGKANESFFVGEESPYATFIKTGKVIVNGKEITVNRNEAEVKKRIKELEGTAKEIFGRWKNSKRKGKPENIRNDLKTRLEFFGHCQTMTFPSDCVEMNNIWSKFVNHFPPVISSISVENDNDSIPVPILVPEIIVKEEVDDVYEDAPPADSDSDSDSTPGISILETQPVKIKAIAILKKKKIKIPRRRRNNLENIAPVETKHKKFGKLSKSMKKRLKRRLSDQTKVRYKLETMISLSSPLPKSKLKSKKTDKPKSGLNFFTNFESFTSPPPSPDSPGPASEPEPPSPSPPNSPIPIISATAEALVDQLLSKPLSQAKAKATKTAEAEVEVEEAPMMCELCGELFPSKAEVIQHKSVIHNIHPPGSKCLLCQEEFRTGLLLWKHFEEMHKTKTGETFLERRRITQKSKVDRLPRSSSSKETANEDVPPPSPPPPPPPPKDPVVCRLCGKFCDDQQSLSLHVRHEHTSTLKCDAEKSFLCTQCPKIFKSKCWLTAHIKQDHLGISFRCDLCNKNMQAAGKLWKHKVDVHGLTDLEPPPGVTVLQCYICGEQMLRGLDRHIEKSHPEQFHETAEAKRIRELEEKRNAINKKRTGRYRKKRKSFDTNESDPCPHCGALIGRNPTRLMANHLQTEHGLGEPCPVEGCTKTFVNVEYNMQRHIRELHPNFHLANNLIEVVKVVKPKRKDSASTNNYEEESDEWNWKCDICTDPPTFFVKKDEIAIHFLLKHQQTLKLTEKERHKSKIDLLQYPLECLHCEERICGEENLRNHVETEHPSKCWKCPKMDCERIITSKDDLQEHSYLEHGRGRWKVGEWKRFYEKEVNDRIARGLPPLATCTIRWNFYRFRRERKKMEGGGVQGDSSTDCDSDFEEKEKLKTKKIQMKISRRGRPPRAAVGGGANKKTSVKKKSKKIIVKEEPETDTDSDDDDDNGLMDYAGGDSSDSDFNPGKGNLSHQQHQRPQQQQQKKNDNDIDGDEEYADTIAGRRKRMKRNSSKTFKEYE